MGCTLNPYFGNGSQWCQRECNFGGDAEGIKEQLQGIRERVPFSLDDNVGSIQSIVYGYG